MRLNPRGTSIAALGLLALASLSAATGTAYVSIIAAGQATVTVVGLAATTAYLIHVHDLSCGLNDGGVHYKIDTSIATAVTSPSARSSAARK